MPKTFGHNVFGVGLLLVFSLYLGAPQILPSLNLSIWDYETGRLSFDPYADTDQDQIVFVGDVLLARDVEMRMDRYGVEYPFIEAAPYLTSTHVVGNFEAAIPEIHEPTPYLSTRFSVRTELANVLGAVGFTHLSLANNHAYDFGQPGFAHTADTLSQNLAVFGNPRAVSTSSVAYLEVDEYTVALIGIEMVSVAPDPEAASALVEAVSKQSDIQVAYVHWGVEYELTESGEQETWAKQLIASGVDAIVGHHPHVVQPIDIIDGVPVLYSLGNFVFDQYFSPEVQDGLLVAMTIVAGQPNFTLYPFTSRDRRAQPRPMTDVEARVFLADLTLRSGEAYVAAVRDGQIAYSLQFDHASSSMSRLPTPNETARLGP